MNVNPRADEYGYLAEVTEDRGDYRRGDLLVVCAVTLDASAPEERYDARVRPHAGTDYRGAAEASWSPDGVAGTGWTGTIPTEILRPVEPIDLGCHAEDIAARLTRGDWVRQGRSVGRMVGVTPAGVTWICWSSDSVSNFDGHCAAFDAAAAEHARRTGPPASSSHLSQIAPAPAAARFDSTSGQRVTVRVNQAKRSGTVLAVIEGGARALVEYQMPGGTTALLEVAGDSQLSISYARLPRRWGAALQSRDQAWEGRGQGRGETVRPTRDAPRDGPRYLARVRAALARHGAGAEEHDCDAGTWVGTPWPTPTSASGPSPEVLA